VAKGGFAQRQYQSVCLFVCLQPETLAAAGGACGPTAPRVPQMFPSCEKLHPRSEIYGSGGGLLVAPINVPHSSISWWFQNLFSSRCLSRESKNINSMLYFTKRCSPRGTTARSIDCAHRPQTSTRLGDRSCIVGQWRPLSSQNTSYKDGSAFSGKVVVDPHPAQDQQRKN